MSYRVTPTIGVTALLTWVFSYAEGGTAGS